MSAPIKTTGGSKNTAAKAPDARRSARGSARSERQSDLSSAVPDRRRAENIRRRTPEKAGRSAEPPRYSNHSARPKILEAARKTAAEHGYDRLRLKHITDEAGISHQAFYGHFSNKRHAVAVATSDELGAIADLAMRGSKQAEEWAQRMLTDIDRTLVAAYPATDGPERWLRDRICEAVTTEGGYGSLRILELIRVSTLGHGEFYRRYGGKRGCLQRIYADALGEVRAEAGEDLSLQSIAESIASDPQRAKLLILGAPHLPDCEDVERATQGSLPRLLVEVVAFEADGELSGRHALAIAGGALEVIRSAVLTDSLERLPDEISSFALAREGRSVEPVLRLVA